MLGLLAIGGLFAWTIHEGKRANEENENRRQETLRRKNTPCEFSDGLSRDEFEEIAVKVCKKIKRVKKATVEGPFVYGEVESKSGLSTWSFCVDFNDYGHITGKFWITSQNDDSNIPNHIGELISQTITATATSNNCNNDYDYDEDDNEDTNVDNCSFLAAKSAIADHRTRKSKVRIIMVVALILCIVGVLGYKYGLDSKLIPVGTSASDLVGNQYLDVMDALSEAGFTNILENEISDLSYAQLESDGIVTEVSIDKSTSFSPVSKYAYDTEVIVTYHSLRLVHAPISAKEVKGQNYTVVNDAFLTAGFGNIILVPVEDVMLGWFHKAGEVASVSIDDNRKYDIAHFYRPDVQVVIEYHTFKP